MVYYYNDGNIHGDNFEVDSTESVWYSPRWQQRKALLILKLTPQSQYGILSGWTKSKLLYFEVDSTESVWYTLMCSSNSSLSF